VIILGITAVNQNQINQFIDETGITYPILKDQTSGGSGPSGFGGVIYDQYYIPNQGSPYPRDFIVDGDGKLVYANNEVDTEYMLYIIDDLMDAEELYAYQTDLVPERLTFYPVYPNPFNLKTIIRFDLLGQNNISLRLNIYDVTGRLVDKFLWGVFDPGEHTITWHANNYSSSLYIIAIESNFGIQSQKVFLLK